MLPSDADPRHRLNAREQLNQRRCVSGAIAFSPAESGDSMRKSRALFSAARSDEVCARGASEDVEVCPHAARV